MIFPVGDDQVQGGHKPLFAYGFLLLNILVFFYEISLGFGSQAFVTEYGALPGEITAGQDYFTLFTSMFLHGGWMHLIGNMFFLWVFADNIEATIGSVPFVLFYLIGGLAAHAAHIYSDPASMIPTVGASGAISAVLGAYIVMFPTSRIKILVFLFYSTYLSAFIFLGLWIVMQVFSGFSAMSEVPSDGGGTAWWAHIGGFAFGIVAGILFRKMYHPVRLSAAEVA